MIWLKKQKIVLECVTYREEVAMAAPIARAGHFLPQWWKDLPASMVAPNNLYNNPTMKTCVGMIQEYSYGIMLPLWSDLSLTVGAKGSSQHYYQFADATSSASYHSPDQRGDFMPDQNFLHLKINVPWQIYCDEDVDFFFTEPTWNMPSDVQYKVLSGIVNYKYQNNAGVNIIFPRSNETQKMLLHFGQPLAHIIPLDKRPLEIKIIVDEKRYKNTLESNTRHLSFLENYKKKRAILKTQGTKCPHN